MVADGPATDRIFYTAEKEKADLIAMTSHGLSELNHVFHGSVTLGLLNRVDHSLRVIRSREE